MPIRQPSPTRRQCTHAWWPIATSSPISSISPLRVCSITWSWIEQRAPTRIGATSPRMQVNGHTLVSAPKVTSPTTIALPATNASPTRRIATVPPGKFRSAVTLAIVTTAAKLSSYPLSPPVAASARRNL